MCQIRVSCEEGRSEDSNFRNRDFDVLTPKSLSENEQNRFFDENRKKKMSLAEKKTIFSLI